MGGEKKGDGIGLERADERANGRADFVAERGLWVVRCRDAGMSRVEAGELAAMVEAGASEEAQDEAKADTEAACETSTG